MLTHKDKIIDVKVIKVLKRIIKLALILSFSCIVGQALMILVYCLPTDTISQNIERGSEALLIQGSGYNYAEDYRESTLDNETDAVMLSEACFPAASPKSGGGTGSEVYIRW